MVDQNTRQHIIEALTKGTKKTTAIRGMISDHGFVVSKQAFYKALNKLLRAETVVKHKDVISLSKPWIIDKEKEMNSIHHHYKTSSLAQPTLSLKEGEKFSYTVNSMQRLDLLLLENLYYVAAITKPKIVCVWSTHDIFLLARPEPSKQFLDEMKRQKTLTLVAIEGKTELDKWPQKLKMFSHKLNNYGVSCDVLKTKSNIVNVLGDIIIEVTLGQKTKRVISTLFETYKTVPSNLEELLEDILQIKEKHKMVIRRHRKKAEIMRKKIASCFFIPEEYRKDVAYQK